MVVNQELHTDSSGRSCRHLEFKIDPTRVRYEAGDHIGIFPKNNPDLVTRIAKLLSTDLETVFKLINLDGKKKILFLILNSFQKRVPNDILFHAHVLIKQL